MTTEKLPQWMPKTILVGADTYTVVVDNTINAMGLCYFEEAIIKVRTRSDTDVLPRSIIMDTLLHEVIHAIESFCGLKVQEKRVRPMTSALLMVLSQNPKLRKAIEGSL